MATRRTTFPQLSDVSRPRYLAQRLHRALAEALSHAFRLGQLGREMVDRKGTSAGRSEEGWLDRDHVQAIVESARNSPFWTGV